MVTGKVVRFDEGKGYGFLAPDGGGEDVFVHVNDLDFDKRLLSPGALVEFDIEDGDRGLKASQVRILGRSAAGPRPGDEEGYGDVLSAREFLEEITEALLNAAPEATAEQILRVRQRLVQVAHSHGWIDA